MIIKNGRKYFFLKKDKKKDLANKIRLLKIIPKKYTLKLREKNYNNNEFFFSKLTLIKRYRIKFIIFKGGQYKFLFSYFFSFFFAFYDKNFYIFIRFSFLCALTSFVSANVGSLLSFIKFPFFVPK